MMALLMPCGLSWASASDEGLVYLVKEGKPVAVIVVADEPLPVSPGIGGLLVVRDAKSDHNQRAAAERLQQYIAKATGATLPIVPASQASSRETQILVGQSALSQKLGIQTPAEEEGVKIKSFPGGVAILGEVTSPGTANVAYAMDRGTLHAVSFFLENYLGFRFYMDQGVEGDKDFGTVIPTGDTLSIPSDIDFTTTPKHHLRFTYGFFGSEIRLGNPRQMLIGHTDDSWRHRYSKDHPTYFCLQSNGSRNFKYLCYSSPEMLAQRVRNIEDWYSQGKKPLGHEPSDLYVAVTPTDNLADCHCGPCTAGRSGNPYRRYKDQPQGWGTQSEAYFGHVRDLADEVKKRWPQRRVMTLAYQGYTLPPTFDLPDNVDVVLCVLSPSHIYKEPEARQRVMELVKAWSAKLGGDRNRLYIWDYPVWPGMWTAAPVIYPHVKQRWLRDFGPYIGGEYLNSRGRSPQESHWFINVWFRMLWDPELDVDAHLHDYCQQFFGPAGEPMERFYRRVIERYEQVQWSEHAVDYGAGLFRGIYGQTYTPEVIEELEGYMSEAVLAISQPSSHPHADLYRRRVLWMRQWAEAFSPSALPRQGRMGFFVEARQAHQWASTTRRYRAARVSQPPEADFADPLWQNAVPTFLLQGKDDLRSGRNPYDRFGFPADLPTRVQVLHDDKAIYVAFRSSQRHQPTANDDVSVAFYDNAQELVRARVNAENRLWASSKLVESSVQIEQGRWGAFLVIPREVLKPHHQAGQLRVSFTRTRSRDAGEGQVQSGQDEIELPLPVGAQKPLNVDAVFYTWHALIDGNLGWNPYPWQSRGMVIFE